MELDERVYKSGFNIGYIINKHLPTLFESLEKGILTDSSFFVGFKNGGKEYLINKEIELLRNLRDKSKQSKEIDRGR